MKLKAASPAPSFIPVVTDEGPLIVAYKIERSARLKRMYLHVDTGRMVVLKIPLRASLGKGLEFLQANGEWIRRTLSSQESLPSLREHLRRHPRLSVHGKWVPVTVAYHRGSPVCECSDHPAMIQFLVPSLEEPVLVRLLQSCAGRVLTARVHDLARQHRLKVHGVQVRNQKNRWGSCSETGGISLNWRLILLPPHLQDHVILHELAHLRCFDHSQAFYRQLQKFDPKSEAHNRELSDLTARYIQMGRAG